MTLCLLNHNVLSFWFGWYSVNIPTYSYDSFVRATPCLWYNPHCSCTARDQTHLMHSLMNNRRALVGTLYHVSKCDFSRQTGGESSRWINSGLLYAQRWKWNEAVSYFMKAYYMLFKVFGTEHNQRANRSKIIGENGTWLMAIFLIMCDIYMLIG